MSEQELPEELLEQLQTVTNKRAKIVIEHILENGYITTEELEKTYGYSHPPRAARDVREHGIPLETFQTKSSDGRTIAAYKFGDLSQIRAGQLAGRKVFSKALKQHLFEAHQGKCAICTGKFETRYLQIDHRIPYEIAGDEGFLEKDARDYMLLCGTCNRAKSWSCEHCPNWTEKRIDVCEKCYWASPQHYEHIALRKIRRTDIVWDESEIDIYDELARAAQEAIYPLPEFVKKIIELHLKNRPQR
jgi:5-methylcytosine-specific restriction endonuclease McrA